MNSKIIANGILRAIGVLAAIAIVLLFLFKIQSVLIYLAIAAVISLIANPFLNFLQKKLKVPNTLSVVISMSFFLLIIFGESGIIRLFIY